MKIWPVLAVFTFVFFAGVAHAADPVRLDIAGIDEQPGQMRITLNTIGPDGKALANLSPDSFRVSLNDTPMSLKDLQVAPGGAVPTSVLLLVDVSGSMAGDPINQARSAMQGFIGGLDPNAQLAVMAFDTRVNLLQDFTADRDALQQALGRLTPLGDTALYDAVGQGVQKLSEAPPGRHVVVLLTDGLATSGLDKRAASIAAAKASGANVFAIGLGTEVDKQYLGDLTSASGGSLLTALTPAALGQLYTDLASTIKSQYTIVLQMPPTLDRTVPVKLNVRLVTRQGSASVERQLGPLEGALPPPFELNVQGIGKKNLTGPTTVTPVVAKDINVVKVDYTVDDKLVESSTTPPFTHEIDLTGLTGGAHLLRVVATDAAGRQGQTQIAFGYVAPAPPRKGVPKSLLLIVLPCLMAGGLIYFFIKKRKGNISDYEVRVKPWTGRATELAWTGTGVEGWPEPKAPAAAKPSLPPADPVLGRLIVMQEEAIRSGNLNAITEYEMHSTPLTFGTGRSCDVVVVDDEQGRIAAEEARIWVQRGRLVYHKLTTLSAMATEGVTSGWLFLDNGEDVLIGPYRLIFQAEAPAYEEPIEEPVSKRPPQEHGMAMRGLWNGASDEPQTPWDPSLKPE